ncbi:NADPH-dependent FMN reductase [Lewinella cohaerens]|uniref:NADPH-dependent FMN reductase n=1 Tax=Lewinella cohaerens TaxID=70995 RepID=UPI0003667DC5|nr:NAD(P)H-dependent oxidoreductase [Lewinella cohaerens]
MNILTLSGSARPGSSNQLLLEAIAAAFPDYRFTHFAELSQLPLFLPALDHAPWPASVVEWRQALRSATAVIITTPEYIHNLPALLKNALEWIASSGELVGKPVLPITFTPHTPRGERAMQSLLWSLGALDARIVAELPLYQNEMEREGERLLLSADAEEMMGEALKLLEG